MKVLIFGAKGYMGQYFLTLYPDAATPSLDIADSRAVADVLDTEKPDVVINCAGKTGRPNVDWCDSHKEETIHSNVIGPLVLIEECGKRDMYLVQIGTGCVYSGDSSTPFTETDPPNFFGSFYSRSKGALDQLLDDFPVLNIRLRMPFDGTDSERNLINKIKKYDRLLDTENSMTYIPDLLSAVGQLIEKRATGPYNIVNPGVMTPYRMMNLYKEIVDPDHTFELLKEEDLPEVATTGRSSCVLSGKKLESEGIAMKPVEDAAREALKALKSA
ncbi:MAG: sugar nucleotide-binding protein [Candidatus Peribacteraceae bacterium]|jgi:dTDP-4-dehydrorhamnose reductase|nr:sugar nucleotide-binding protein [Candidatus Peribacteraceae bacterium]